MVVRFNQNNSVLVGIPRATLQQYLVNAQIAYNALMTGGKAVSVAYEGKSVTYTQAQKADLLEYIEMLNAALGNSRPRRALRPVFR